MCIRDSTTTDERISVEGMTRFSSVIDGGEDVDTIYLTDSSNGDAFFLHDSYSGLHESITAVDDGFGRETVARVISIETINAGDGDEVIDLTSPTFDMADVNMTSNGEEGSHTLWAAEGHNILDGGAGDDILFGGAGTNVFNGGNGEKVFAKNANTVVITASDRAIRKSISDFAQDNAALFPSLLAFSYPL